MKTKLIYVENGKITFTRKELEDLLQETYDEGYRDGSYYSNTATRSTQTITIRNGNKTGGDSWENPFSYTSNLANSNVISVNDNNTISATNISSSPLNISTEDIIDGAVEALLGYNKDGFSKVKNTSAYPTNSKSNSITEKNK